MAFSDMKRYQGYWLMEGDEMALSCGLESSWDTLEEVREYLTRYEQNLSPEDTYLAFVQDRDTGEELDVLDGELVTL
jgi:hypothetical protein